jgi:tetratricopeptide (TPR) repeat protein
LRVVVQHLLFAACCFQAMSLPAAAKVESSDTKGSLVALRAAIREDELALAARSRVKNPQGWAALNAKLGREHLRLGRLTGDVGLFQKSANDFDAALEVWSKRTEPDLWAMTELVRGDALAAVGELKHETFDLTKAVEAYRSAAAVITPRHHAPQYGALQNNMAKALIEIGDIEHAPGRLQEGMAAAKEALEIWQRTHDRKNWVMTRASLGIAYLDFGKFTGNEESIRQAADVERSVLDAKDVKFEPPLYAAWAAALSDALVQLAVHGRDTKKLDDAAEAIRVALKLAMPDNIVSRTELEANLGFVLRQQAFLTNKPDTLYGAISAYEAALQQWPATLDRDKWADVEASYGDTLLKLAETYKLPERFMAANGAYRKALEVFSPGHFPQFYILANRRMGASLMELAIATHRKDYAEQGVVAFNAALSVKKGDPELQRLIARAEVEVSNLQPAPATDIRRPLVLHPHAEIGNGP